MPGDTMAAPHPHAPSTPQAPASSLQRNTIIGLVASTALAGVKFLAGVLGHSSALIADAVESLADSIGSIVVWHALRVAERPPTERHPYGYGKAEALASLFVGLLLLGASAWIVSKAFHELLTPHDAPRAWTLLVLVAVILVKELLFRLILTGATQHQSDAAKADAWHHRSDAVTSAAALVGVAVAIWGPRWFGMPRLVLADEVAALLASGIIVLTAFSLITPSLQELLDASSQELIDEVRRTASAVEGVRLVEKIHARKSGRGHHLDMHVHVDPHLTVKDAHALSGKVRATIRAAHPTVRDVLIHIEPANADLYLAPN